jgi:hypothetical protein
LPIGALKMCSPLSGIRSETPIRSCVKSLTDFFDYSGIQTQFVDRDACFFCLGVSSLGSSQSEYYHLTYDLTLAAAQAIVTATSGRLTFCYVSGQGTDSTERGRSAWARTKGKTENALLRLPFKSPLRRKGQTESLHLRGSAAAKLRPAEITFQATLSSKC